jgi:glycosyltransferase involved in cell wall biosynthesis
VTQTSPTTIAFVSDAIYPYNKGGKETRLHEISRSLANLGYDVHIYCMKWWSGDKHKIEEGVHLHGICPYIPLYSGTRRSIFQGIAFGLSCFKLIFEKFDVIDVDHMPFFPLYSTKVVCLLKGKKMHATWHEVWGMEYWKNYLGNFKSTIAGLIERFSVLLPDTIYAISPSTAQRLQEKLHYSGKLVLIPNGVDKKRILSAKISNITSDVIFAGRLLNHKNVDLLIEAISLTKKARKDIKLIIVGEGPEKENLEQLAKKLNLEKNVIFSKFKSDVEEVYGLIKASKVFVLPSSREGFGLVVLEANACGLPVITVDHPDNAAKDLIKDSIRGKVSELSAKALASHILFYLESEKETYSLTKPAKLFSWNEVSKIYSSKISETSR